MLHHSESHVRGVLCHVVPSSFSLKETTAGHVAQENMRRTLVQCGVVAAVGVLWVLLSSETKVWNTVGSIHMSPGYVEPSDVLALHALPRRGHPDSQRAIRKWGL